MDRRESDYHARLNAYIEARGYSQQERAELFRHIGRSFCSAEVALELLTFDHAVQVRIDAEMAGQDMFPFDFGGQEQLPFNE